MAWSIDWFSAELLAQAGSHIRRVGWTDRWIEKQGALYFLVTAGHSTVVQATDITIDDLRARDWTDQPFSANPCSATPAYNSAPPVYGTWDNIPIFLPPPAPGFPSS